MPEREFDWKHERVADFFCFVYIFSIYSIHKDRSRFISTTHDYRNIKFLKTLSYCNDIIGESCTLLSKTVIPVLQRGFTISILLYPNSKVSSKNNTRILNNLSLYFETYADSSKCQPQLVSNLFNWLLIH